MRRWYCSAALFSSVVRRTLTTRSCADSSLPFEKVLVINLPERQDRWRYVSDQLTRVAGIPVERLVRVPAVNGKALLAPPSAPCGTPETEEGTPFVAGKNPEVLDRLCQAGLLSSLGRLRLEAPEQEKVWGMDLTDGAVGCALSHLQVWQQILVEAHAGGCWEGTPKCSTSTTASSLKYSTSVMSCFPPRQSPDARRVFLVVEDDAAFSSDFLAQYHQRVTGLYEMREALSLPEWHLLYVGGLDTGRQCAEITLEQELIHRSGGDRNALLFALQAQVTRRASLQRSGSLSLKEIIYALQHLCRVPLLHRTTTGYAITAEGAYRLTQQCFPLTFQLDTEMTRRATPASENHKKALKPGGIPFVQDPPCFTLQPPLIHQNEALGTDIQGPQRF